MTSSCWQKFKKKRIGDTDTNKKIYSRYRNGIWHRKMCHAHNRKKWIKTNNGRNKTTKSRKKQKARKKEKLQVLGNIGSGNNETSRDERKSKIRVPQMNEKIFETKLCSWNFIKGINTWAVPFVRYSRPFLKMDKRRTQTNGPEEKKVDDYAKGFIFER